MQNLFKGQGFGLVYSFIFRTILWVCWDSHWEISHGLNGSLFSAEMSSCLNSLDFFPPGLESIRSGELCGYVEGMVAWSEFRSFMILNPISAGGGGPNVPAHLENAIYSKFYLGK